MKLKRWLKARSHCVVYVMLRILELSAVGVNESVYVGIKSVFLKGGERF